MAIVYSKVEQGVTYYMCDSVPVHSANLSDQAIDNSTGISYYYDGVNWVALYSSGSAGGSTFPYTGSAIISGSLQVTGSVNISGSLVASGLAYPTADQENGDVLTTDGTGNLTFEKPTVYAKVKNATAGTLPKGMPVHASSSVGNVNEVIVASASNAATMPATFILAEQLTAGQEGLAIATGFINGVDTSGFSEGQVVYVGANGGYTNVKPTGSNLIQNLGIVTKVAVNGSGFVLGAGRSNDVPNITAGYTWIGNADGVATATATSSIQNVISSSYSTTASYAISASYEINHETSSSFAETASYVNPLNQTVLISDSLGIGTTTPSYRLSISGSSGLIENRVDETLPYTSEIYGKTTNASGSSVIQLVNDSISSIVMGVLGSNRSASVAYGGESNDAFLFASTAANNLNIFNGAGTGTEDSINFYAGNNAAATPHLHIHGSGSTKGYVGIGTTAPTEIFEVVQNTENFKLNLNNSTGPEATLSTPQTDKHSRFGVSAGVSAVTIDAIGFGWTGSTVYGNPGDSSIYSTTSANGVNIISAPGTGTEDYIRLYAGGNPQTSTASIHIHGTGSTKGWVGIGMENPEKPVHIYSNNSAPMRVESTSTVTQVQFKDTNTTNLPFIGSSGNKFQIGHITGGETLTVTDAGNVGIGTDVPEDTLTVLGSFNLREYGTITAPISSPGWYRLGYTSDSDRGGIRVVISYTGGNWSPVTYVINAFKNRLTNVSSLSLEKYGSDNYITEARIVEDEIDSTTYHLEVYLASLGVGHSARVYFDKNLGYEGIWNLNTGSLSASTSTATPVARSPFTSADGGYTLENLVINDNVNNQFWKFEDTSGSLEIKDWNSDNLITFDGVNDRVGIGTTAPNSTLDVNGNTTISGSLTVTSSVQAPNITNTETDQVLYYNTSSGAFTYGAKPGPQGNAQVDDFYYSISNSSDTRPIFEDTNVLFNWDETGNQLEFQMKVAPGGSGDMRSLGYIVGGSTQNTAIVSTGVNYDVYAAGVSAGNRLEVFITAENDVTYPAYHVTVYNTGESFQNTVWIQRITRN